MRGQGWGVGGWQQEEGRHIFLPYKWTLLKLFNRKLDLPQCWRKTVRLGDSAQYKVSAARAGGRTPHLEGLFNALMQTLEFSVFL